MIIGIIPAVKENFKNQFEFIVEEKLIIYLKKVFPKCKIKILFEKEVINFQFLVISGGNDLIKHYPISKNLTRASLNNYYFNLAKNKKLPVLGICHGAHFIADKYQAKINKSNKHVGYHKIQILNGARIEVLSHHNYVIKKVSKRFEILANAEDNTVELFKIKKMKVLGIVWHPERQKKFNNFEKNLIKKLCI